MAEAEGVEVEIPAKDTTAVDVEVLTHDTPRPSSSGPYTSRQDALATEQLAESWCGAAPEWDAPEQPTAQIPANGATQFFWRVPVVSKEWSLWRVQWPITAASLLAVCIVLGALAQPAIFDHLQKDHVGGVKFCYGAPTPLLIPL